jgi:hypothetical protein
MPSTVLNKFPHKVTPTEHQGYSNRDLAASHSRPECNWCTSSILWLLCIRHFTRGMGWIRISLVRTKAHGLCQIFSCSMNRKVVITNSIAIRLLQFHAGLLPPFNG